MYVALAAVVGMVVGGGIVYLLATGRPLPLWDRGFHIFVARDEGAQRALVDLLSACGLKPRFAIGAGPVKRAVMNYNMTVISVTSPEVLEEMGMPDAGLAVV